MTGRFKDTRKVYIEAQFMKYCQDNDLIFRDERGKALFMAGVKAATEPIEIGHCERIDKFMEEHRV